MRGSAGGEKGGGRCVMGRMGVGSREGVRKGGKEGMVWGSPSLYRR